MIRPRQPADDAGILAAYNRAVLLPGRCMSGAPTVQVLEFPQGVQVLVNEEDGAISGAIAWIEPPQAKEPRVLYTVAESGSIARRLYLGIVQALRAKGYESVVADVTPATAEHKLLVSIGGEIASAGRNPETGEEHVAAYRFPNLRRTEQLLVQTL
jgi:hypothetical protein